MSHQIFKRTTVTAALPYANGPLHIGHIAGCYLPADIYVRFLKSTDSPVLFICGSDEHGVGITIKAEKEGLSPKELIDIYHPMMRDAFIGLGIDFDHYSRTSSPTHYATAQDFFTILHDKGVFIKKESEQFFDTHSHKFLADRYIYGTCPNCSYPKAYGDQCENCGKSLDPFDLIDPKSALSHETPEKRKTEHFYLPLQNYEPWLTDFIIEGKKNKWKNNVYGQCKSWITQGLHERAITRDLDWGVPVPLPEAEGKKLYVWFDAPIGYISATKEWAELNNQDWEPWWKGNDTELIHFIGKDNIVFHGIIFPIMLKEHGDFILPENIPANEFLNIEGDKISTSRNWAVWLHEYLVDFPMMQDTLRYVLCANAPENKDNDFTWKDFQAKNNGELSAVLGNLVNRINILLGKNYERKIPEISSELLPIDLELMDEIKGSPQKIADCLRDFKFRDGLNEMISLARAGNKYLTENEPWKLIKTDPERTKTVLHLSAQLIGNLAILMAPFIPFAAKKLEISFGMEGKKWKDAGNTSLLDVGTEFKPLEILFPQITDEMVAFQMKKLNDKKPKEEIIVEVEISENVSEIKAVPPLKENISFEDFAKIDLRVGTILEAEKVQGTDKLMKFLLDIGLEKRTVISGVALHFTPEDLLGKQVVLVANLSPRKIKGIESKGMILYPETLGGQLKLLCPYTEVENGSMVA